MHFHRALTRVIAAAYGRVVGVVVLLYGGWIFAGNVPGKLFGNSITGGSDSPAILWAILAFGMVGFLSALGFLLTFDGPSGWRSTRRRATTWMGMFVCALLPSSLVIFIMPLVVVAALTILAPPEPVPVATRP